MVNAVSKNIYYVSKLGTDTVSIIDGDNLSIIEEVKVGPRPYDIAIDNKNNVYIATDRNNKVTIIDHATKTEKRLYIPNNGHIKVDSISQRIYVSSTEEVHVYSLYDGEELGRINGFIAVDCIDLNSDGSKLFILDIFQNEIKVYDTSSLMLIKKYNKIGMAPNYIFIEDEERYIYISNKSASRGKFTGNIHVVDLESDKISYIEFPLGSSITDLEGNSNYLYAVNNGLNRIDIIDLKKYEVTESIKTTLEEPQKIRISLDKRLLLVTSKDNKGRGALDIIDIEKQIIVNTFKFKENNCNPYDIGVIKEEKILYNSLEENLNENKESAILANKVISTYKEKIIFQQETNELLSEEIIEVEEVIFEKCKVVEESKSRELIDNKRNYLIFKFEFYIPYYISCINSKKEKIIIKGILNGKQKAVLYIEDNNSLDDLDFIIRSSTQLMITPYIKDRFIIFDASSIITTYIIKEELVFLPDKLKELWNEQKNI